VRRLVAVDLPAGPAFYEALCRYLDQGDALLPLDPRLAPPVRTRLLEEMRPAAILTEAGEEPLRGALPMEDGDALVVATSGTTGTPKGVVLSADAVAASAAATGVRLGVDVRRDGFLCCLPLAHVGGLSVLTRARFLGAAIEVQPGFEREAVLAATARGATIVSLVPTALRRLGEEAQRFRQIVLGGSAPPDGLASNVVTTYGLTETGSGVVYDGRPLDGVEIALGPTGEISLRGPMLLRAYRDGTDPKDANGWLATGDIGSFAADGRLVVHGRRDDLIITGGENVWPAVVEAVLDRHPGVAEVCVAGVPDPEWGARVVAFVVPTERAAPVTLDELRGLVRAELGAIAAPKQLVVVEALPRTALGKVRRTLLPALAADGGRASAGRERAPRGAVVGR
jgi:O-succinylbenzoic acid--CoA ligase